MSQINNTPPSSYPYTREWGITSVDLNRYLSIQDNWGYSIELIKKIKNLLENNSNKIDSAVETVVAAGSIGRMEAAPNTSDADLIIVLSDDLNTGQSNGDLHSISDEAKKAYESVWELIDSLEPTIPRPKKTGIFAKPTSLKELTNSMGDVSEHYRVFGKRLLLLLETQPVFKDNHYTSLIDKIVDKYAREYVKTDPRKEWTLLLNDLIRYFRSLAVNYQWDFNNEFEKWPIRNIKLRHSRTVMYSGLLTLLGEASKERHDKVSWLKERLKMTPLERLAWVYAENKDWNFYRIMGPYDVFLSRLNDPKIRESLNVDVGLEEAPGSYSSRYSSIPEYPLLKANSDALAAELLRFTFAQRGSWSERFFEYLIF